MILYLLVLVAGHIWLLRSVTTDNEALWDYTIPYTEDELEPCQ